MIYSTRGEDANYYISDEYLELNSMQNSKCSKSWYSIVTLVWSYYDDMPLPLRKKTHSKAKIKQKQITDLIFIICQKIICQKIRLFYA